MSNRILKRKVLRIQVRFTAPLCVSSGEEKWTDSDILKDADGKPFVAGSSVAGAMRAYLENEKDCPGMMGYLGTDGNGKMSSVYISDMIFDEKTVAFSIRDGVSLNDNKTSKTESKYDMEILQAGVEAYFFIELVIREEDDESEMDSEIKAVIYGINQSEIRLGNKKTRGFGAFEVTAVSCKCYDKTNYLAYAQAYENKTWMDAENEIEDYKFCSDRKYVKTIKVEVPLRMKGGISIRQYAARKGEPDYVHLTDHGMPVIPGTSFAGAIRHRIKDILSKLEKNGTKMPADISDVMDYAFGFVNKKEACASGIIIDEAVILHAKPLTMTRTGVSRFEGAVKKGALYTDRTYVDGDFILRMSVQLRDNPADAKWIMGILMLAVKDLQNGFLAVGGLTSVGRGVFCENGPVLIDGKAGEEDGYIADILTNMSSNGGMRA